MSNRSSHFVHGLQSLPSVLAGVSGSRRLLALAAVLALLALMFQPTAAQAQTVTTVWSATLTPASTGGNVGCTSQTDSDDEVCSSTLTDDSFDYYGTTYVVTDFLLFEGTLAFRLDNTPTATTIADLTLNIGDSPLTLSSASLSGSNFTWTNTGLTLTADTDVTVTLTAITVAPDDVALVPHDWPLIPSGVSLGQRFRLIFLTSTNRDASSTDIGVYNAFVQGRAAAGHEDIREYSSGFRVVGSTGDVDARDNTATRYTGDGTSPTDDDSDLGVAIYWLGGNKVADQYRDFYDVGWDDEAAPRDESGNPHSLTGQEIFPATGSNRIGQREFVPERVIPSMGTPGFDFVPGMIVPEQPLELGANVVRVGELNNSDGANGPLESTSSQSRHSSAIFYGLSQIFQVDVPQVEEESLLFNVDELPEPVDPPPLVVVPPGWELIPDGLGTGSQFRLLFVTSGLYSADSSDIGVYNSRVRFNAGWGHAALTGYADGFRVVGSTASVHVVTNTGTVFSDASPGVPIYWVKGKKVADDYADFYNRSWDEEREGRSARGEALSRFSRRGLATSGVWTGIGADHELGETTVVMGLPNKHPFYYSGVNLTGPLNSDFMGNGALDSAPLYGLSQVFQVGDSTTEGLEVPTKPRNLRMETCYVHSYQVTNDNDTPDDNTDDTTETRQRGIPLLLTWDPPASDADDTDGIPSSYFYSPYVEVSEDGGGAWKPADGSNAITTQLSYRLGYYPVDETVRFRVWARNAAGGGPPSEPVSVTIPRCGGGEADPVLTITAVRSPVPFLNYEEAGVLPALVDFQVSRTGPWLNAMRFKTTFAQAESVGLPPGPGEWTFSAGNRTRTIQQNLPYNEHWAGERDCAASTCTKPTAVTYRLEECPECGYVLGDPREAIVNVISAEQGRGGEEENTQPLTARFEGLPEGGHGGAGTPFTFRLVFSEAVSATPEGLRDHALKVNNATLEAVSRVDGRSDLWEIRLTPGSNAMVTAALLPAADCDAAGAVCTAGGKMLLNGVGSAIQGPPNSSATGAPAISGTARVGETLTADTSGISDADGLTQAVFSFRWVRNDGNADEDIQDATGATLTLTDAYAGMTVWVEVFFTDDADHEEALTSAATAAVDTPATGLPAISGTALMGETLTADTSGIADADGLTNAVFSHQWIRSYGGDDTEIASATGSTYTLTIDDGASAIKVAVSFTDDEGNEETLTSEPTGVLASDPGPLAVFMVVDAYKYPITDLETLVDGGTLTLDNPDTGKYGIRADPDPRHADYGDIHRVELDLDGPKDVYRSEGIAPYSLYGDSGENYLKGENLPVGHYTLKATARKKNDDVLGILAVSFTVEAPAENTTATGVPTISGTVQVGETLTAGISGIADEDGLTNPGFTYQWARNDGATDTDIQGATASTYTLTGDDEGRTITVTVNFTDAEGNPETLTSDPTGEVEAKPNTSATGLPTITGATQVGQTLTADTSGIADEDGLDNVVFSYQWMADDTNIQDATGSSYTLTEDDEGKAITVRVSFTDDANNEESLTSEPTGQVVPDPGPLTVFKVVDTSSNPDTVLGTLEDGGALTLEDPASQIYGIRVDTDSGHDDHGDIHKVELDLTGAKTRNKVEGVFPYSLYGDEGEGNLTGEDLPIGAYELKATAYKQDGDVLGTLKVSFTVTAGQPAQQPTVVPNTSATGVPTISGTLQVGETLTADTTGIADADGLDNAVFSYQWMADDTNIQDATDATYTLTENDEGKAITVTVSFTDDANNEESLTSEPTGQVVPDPGPLTVFKVVDTSSNPDTVLGTLEDGGALTLANPASGSYGIRVDTDSGHDDHGDIHKVELDLTGAKTRNKVEGVFPYSLYGDEGEGNLTGEDLPAGAYELKATAYKKDGDVLGTLKVSFTVTAGQPAQQPTVVPNTSATGVPTIIGTVQVGQTLTAETSGIADEDGLTNVVFSYQWMADDTNIQDATDATYTLTEDDEGRTITVTVSFTDAEGNPETLTSAPTGEVAAAPAQNIQATGQPTISGTLQVGETLTADTTGIADADGLTTVSYSYQWMADDTNIQGATDATYTLAEDDEGKAIKVLVSFADDAGNMESRPSAPTDAVAAPPAQNSSATGAPSISGTAQVGQTLTADTSGIDDEDGLTNVVFSYQWMADDTNIQGATDATYTLAEDDEGKAIKVTVSFTDAEGNPETLTSDATGEVAAKPNTQATGQPTISGTAQVGETLTADTSGIADEDGLDNVVFSYQWLADDTDIQGATGSGYTLTEDDEGKAITVTVSFTDAEGNPETLTSDATGEVAAKPNTQATGQPTISGTAQVGQTLTADSSGIDDEDGLNQVVFSYQWIRNDGNADEDITGATGSSYTLTEDDEGKTVKVTVSFTDDANNEESLTSAATDAVVALPGEPQSLAGEATAQEIKLTWTAPTGDAVVEYVVYRGILRNGSMNGKALSKYATIEATDADMTYTDENVEEGVEYRYRVAAVNSAGEGKKSNWLDIEA